MHPFQDPTSRSYARMTGGLYLVIAIAGGFSILYVPGALNVGGDPVATFANIADRRGLSTQGSRATW